MRASAAISRGVALLDPTSVCSIIDFPHEVSPRLERFLHDAYLRSLKLWPEAYGRLYRSSGAVHSGANYQHYVERAGLKTLERLVANTGAKTLVAPHFYGAGVLGYYKQQNPQAFTAVVLTDYVPHPIGAPGNLDLYVVADEDAAKTVTRLGIPEERIHPVGIPIDPTFEEPAAAEGVRRDLLKLDDDDLPIVLVMGGGLGGGDLERTVTSLLKASAAMHLVVLCGSNERTRQRLEQIVEQGRGRATILSFTDRVRDLMAAGTVLVTKPGGMSCTEALASGLPQILFHPIPGQEEDNAAAVVRYGAGLIVTRTEEILGETLKVLTSRNHRRSMVESARAAHRPHSARSTAELILAGSP